MGKSLRNISVSGTWIDYLVIREILIAVPNDEIAGRKVQVIFLRKTLAQQNKKVGNIVSMLRGES